jgi:hypothetical protein
VLHGARHAAVHERGGTVGKGAVTLGQREGAVACAALQMRGGALVEQPSDDVHVLILYSNVQQRFAASVGKAVEQNVPGRHVAYYSRHVVGDSIFDLDEGAHKEWPAACLRLARRKLRPCAAAAEQAAARFRFLRC